MMALDQKSLIRDWIAFVKYNAIASNQSDPKTGKLNYLRQVTYEDLSRFLQRAFDGSGLTEQDIDNAIKTAITKNRARPAALQEPKPGTNVATAPGQPSPTGQQAQLPGTGGQPPQGGLQRTPQGGPQAPQGGPQAPQGGQPAGPRPLSPEFQRGKEGAEDVEAREPGQTPPKKSRWKFFEEIKDTHGPGISEQTVEDAINMLLARIQQLAQEKQAQAEANKQKQLQQGLTKILQYISTLSSGEIQELYRLLK